MIRVRFAPSPTGFLHIGGLRTALYNELFARKNGGIFVLRIEDTDRTRLVPGGIENIIRTMAWSGVQADEGPYLDDGGAVQERGDYGPYIQSNRFDIYADHAKKLLANGGAYRCFCSAERLESMKTAMMAERRPIMYDKKCRGMSAAELEQKMQAGEPHVIRLKMPESGNTEFNDAIRGRVSFENALIDDQVLLKSDGFPTYHLANVVDDHLMAISHVIRGEDWLPSTPKHLVLYGLFGWTPPIFAHLPLLLNPDRSKLSKRQGDVAVEEYAEQGYLPEAIVNFVALLGWNPSADREVYAKRELVDAFSLEKINRAGAV
ncbi:MAG: glutamate--tRNA ligase, partial [Patescibacteria group bacterium]